jgi:hypothetical protein
MVFPASPGVNRESPPESTTRLTHRARGQGNRMKIAFCRNNACKDSGQKGAGFPPARE